MATAMKETTFAEWLKSPVSILTGWKMEQWLLIFGPILALEAPPDQLAPEDWAFMKQMYAVRQNPSGHHDLAGTGLYGRHAPAAHQPEAGSVQARVSIARERCAGSQSAAQR